MSRMSTVLTLSVQFICCAVLLGAPARKVNGQVSTPQQNVDAIILLLPDTADLTDPHITVWLDAAKEEGLHLTVVRDSTFTDPSFNASQYAGVILPDQVHIQASDALVSALYSYVQQGGKLMLDFDAGSLTADGFYPIPKSRFSDLVGIDYALYDQLRDKTFGFGPILGTEKTMCALHVPPGKFMPDDGVFTDTTAPLPQDAPTGKMCAVKGYTATYYAATGYVYGFLTFPGFVTQGTYSGLTLLSSPTFGLAAGYRTYGQGSVLFVNLPLGYLKHQTDGVWLNGFLHYFAADVLNLPYLSGVPQGRGGMVLNWHLCAEEAQAPLLKLKSMGIFNQGPFSIHITAGPDAATFGDGLGLNLPNNPVMQHVLHDFAQQGHAVGSHGGWIHDYWGFNAPAILPADPAQQQFWDNLLVWNKQAVEGATGLPVLEYAPPEGNHPEWVTNWLAQNGILGYYFTGNTGMGPTRSYRNGHLSDINTWSVPVCSYGKYATFEEFAQYGIDTTQASSWLVAMVNFGAMHRTSRLVYCHPPGALEYLPSLQKLLGRAACYTQKGTFRWYTITQLCQFLNKRDLVNWNVSRSSDGTAVFNASHPVSLADQTWVLPSSVYAQPVVTQGTAAVTGNGAEWTVVGSGGQTLQFTATLLHP